jgi:hypothetical protein
MPSAKHFAECKISGTRQRDRLPSAALGKYKHTVNSTFTECRTLGKAQHTVNSSFTECHALGKGRHSANRRQEVTVGDAVTVCRVSGPRHSAKKACAECRGQTLGKIYKFFFFNFSKNFSIVFLQSPEQDT